MLVMRNNMSKLIGLALAVTFLLASTNPIHEQFAKYKAVEAYEIRPGILMMPRYSDDGQVCEIGLEKLHYSAEMIRLDSSMSRKEIDQIFEELAPPNERGRESNDSMGGLITRSGHSFRTYTDFENVSIQTVGEDLPKSVEDNIVATLHWKHRKCQ
jgi:hypothetical protein